MKRDNFIFYQSFKNAADSMSNTHRLAFYDAIIEYGLTGKEPESLQKSVRSCWELVKPIIDSNNKKYTDGSKGGRPKKTTGFQNEKSSETTGCELYNHRLSDSKSKEEDEEKEEEKETVQVQEEGTRPLAPLSDETENLKKAFREKVQ